MKNIIINLKKKLTAAKSIPGQKNTIAVNTLLLTALFFPLSVAATDILVSVDRNPVSINESFQITFTASENPDGDPDFSPLARNFEILNQNQSSSYSMINGVAHKNISWALNVMARHSGEFKIPEIAFGDDSSHSVSMVVNEKNSAPDDISTGKDVFLKVQAKPVNPYVQAQVIYTVRLYRRVNIAQASMTEPELENAVVARLGEDKNYNTLVDGQKFVVTERQYAIFPQESGSLEIEPLLLTAQVVSHPSTRSRFDSFFSNQSTRTQKVFSEAVNLNVKSVPKVAQGGHWLPAQQVQLKESWSGDISQMQIGEPLTRTITLLAKGATVSQLPELMSKKPVLNTDNQGTLKSYPDQPVLKEQQKGDGMVALREEKVAFIPSEVGVYHLPAIEIPWWNTDTQQMETARIAAVTVSAGLSDNVKNTQQQPIISDVKIKQPAGAKQPLQTNVWMWVSGALAMGWLLTVFYFLSRRARVKPAKDIQEMKPKLTSLLKEIQKASRDNNATTAKDALIQWGRVEFNESSLGRIALKCDSRIKKEILGLNQYLYAQHTRDWNGQALADAINQYKSNVGKSRCDQEEVLQPLYRS